MERLGELDKIVLDFDGVITSLDIDWRALRQKISGILGREINSILEALRRYYRQREYYVIHVIAEEAELDAVKHATINPEIAAIIRNAKEPVYIATMQSEFAVWRFLKRTGYAKYIADVLGRPSFGSKEQELKFIIKMYKNTYDIAFIDDNSNNIEICKKIGISKCIYYRIK
jgi:phosphoglycolate phosphatase-like HAD superfamily hydrolase